LVVAHARKERVEEVTLKLNNVFNTEMARAFLFNEEASKVVG